MFGAPFAEVDPTGALGALLAQGNTPAPQAQGGNPQQTGGIMGAIMKALQAGGSGGVNPAVVAAA